MKNLLLFGFILLNMINLYSQDIIDPPRLFDKTNTNWEGLDLTKKIINERKFIIGWNWGNRSEKLDEALNMKYYHGYVPLANGQESDDLDVIDSARIIENLSLIINFFLSSH